MKPGDGIALGKRRITIEKSILSFLFRDIVIFGFSIEIPRSPNWFYDIKHYCLLFLAGLLYFGYLDSYMKDISIMFLVISALSIRHARKLEEKYNDQQFDIQTYSLKKQAKNKKTTSWLLAALQPLFYELYFFIILGLFNIDSYI